MGESRRMMAARVVALTLAAVALAACSSPPSPAAVTAAPSAASPGELAPDQNDIAAAIPWYRAERSWDAETQIERMTLIAGTLGNPEPTLSVEVPWAFAPGALAPGSLEIGRRPAVAIAPDGTLVYVSTDEDGGSLVHRTTVAGGGDKVVAEFPELTWTIAISRDATTGYAVVLDPDTGTELGVLRIGLADGAVAQVMEPASRLVEGAGIELAAAISYDAHLAVSADGDWLVRQSCGGRGVPFVCSVDVLHVGTATLTRLEDGFTGRLFGVEAGWVVGQPACRAACPLVAVNAEDGTRLELESALNGSALTVLDGRPVLVSAVEGRQRATALVRQDLVAGQREVIWRAPVGVEPMLNAPIANEAPPAGWVVADLNSVRGGLIAVLVEDGTSVQLPVPPPLPPMGLRQG